MDRRYFIGISGAVGAMLSGGLPLWAIGEKRDGANYGTGTGPSRLTNIGEWTLQDIRDIFQEEFRKYSVQYSPRRASCK